MVASWCFDRLCTSGAHPRLLELQDVAVALLRTPVLLQCLQELATVPRSEFKTLSNEGFVWTNRRHVDMGNWRYTVLYQFLIALAGHHQMQIFRRAPHVGLGCFVASPAQ